MKFKIKYEVADVIYEDYIEAVDELAAEELLVISLDENNIKIISTEPIEENEI